MFAAMSSTSPLSRKLLAAQKAAERMAAERERERSAAEMEFRRNRVRRIRHARLMAELVAGPVTPETVDPPSAKDIIAEVAEKHGYRPADLLANCRKRPLVYARQEAMFLIMRDLPHVSLPMAGKIMGGRDHTTVLHGIKAHAKRNGLPLPRAPGTQPAIRGGEVPAALDMREQG